MAQVSTSPCHNDGAESGRDVRRAARSSGRHGPAAHVPAMVRNMSSREAR